MFRSDVGNFPRPLGVAYIVAQILGGFAGALVAWFLILGTSYAAFGGAIYLNDVAWYFQAIVTELLGTFIVVFFYLTQTEEKTVLSKEKAITCFIIAASYIGARALCAGNHITASGAVLNPGIAIGTCLV
jgi:glycerol uptake facilitator-like aquaporin